MWLASFSLGCGGGGSSGGGASNPFNTSEFQANSGLSRIGALTPYNFSANGQGITVAVIDTGIDVNNNEFTGAIAAASTNIVTNNATNLQDVDGHGTAVAGVLGARKNESFTHGVAFNSTILAVRADDLVGPRFSDVSLASAVNYAVANGAQVINLSLGGPLLPIAVLQAALQNAVNAGVIVVAAAGNEGGESATEALFPARLANCGGSVTCANGFNAQGRMIAVGSVDANNNLSSFSNPAGDTDTGFLVAPGENIITTALGGGLATFTGTSASAPHVTGAVAIILQQFPSLTAEQAVDLLFTTATDLGAVGTDTVFGQGLLNLQAAFQAQGLLGLATSDLVSGPRVDFLKTSLNLGPSFGNALSNLSFMGQAIILDAYDRPFRVDLRNRIISSTPDLTITPFFETEQTQLVEAPLAKGLSLSFGVKDDNQAQPMNENSFFLINENQGLSPSDDVGPIQFLADLGKDSKVALGYDVSGLNFFSNAVTEEVSGDVFFNSSWTSSPQLSLLGKGDSAKFSHLLGNNTKLDFGIHWSDGFSSSSSSDLGAGHLTQLQLYHKKSSNLRFGLSAGYILEEQALFSSTASGAFGDAKNSNGQYASLSASWKVGEKTSVYGTYTDANVKPSFSGKSLFGNWSRIYANSFVVGLVTRSQIKGGDKLGVSFGQPLRVRSSTVDLTLPVGRDLSGNVIQETQRVNLTPTGRQIDIQLAYSSRTLADSEITFFTIVSAQPGHDRSAKPHAAIGFKWRIEF